MGVARLDRVFEARNVEAVLDTSIDLYRSCIRYNQVIVLEVTSQAFAEREDWHTALRALNVGLLLAFDRVLGVPFGEADEDEATSGNGVFGLETNLEHS